MIGFIRAFIFCLKTAPFGVSIALILHAINSFALLLLLPIGSYTKDGKVLSLTEFWISGAAFAFLAYGLVSLFIVIGILRRIEWIRMVVSFWFLAISVWNFFLDNNGAAAVLVAICIVTLFYFYVNHQAKDYFRTTEQNASERFIQ